MVKTRVEIQPTSRFCVFAAPGTSCAVRWPHTVKRKPSSPAGTPDNHKKSKPSPSEAPSVNTVARDLSALTFRDADGSPVMADDEQVPQVRAIRTIQENIGQQCIGGPPLFLLATVPSTIPLYRSLGARASALPKRRLARDDLSDSLFANTCNGRCLTLHSR